MHNKNNGCKVWCSSKQSLKDIHIKVNLLKALNPTGSYLVDFFSNPTKNQLPCEKSNFGGRNSKCYTHNEPNI